MKKLLVLFVSLAVVTGCQTSMPNQATTDQQSLEPGSLEESRALAYQEMGYEIIEFPTKLKLMAEDVTLTFPDAYSLGPEATINFGPEKFIPESPTDKEYLAPIYSLTLFEYRTAEQIIKSETMPGSANPTLPTEIQIGDYTAVKWSSGGLCDYRAMEVIGNTRNWRFWTSGCHNDAETDFDYFVQVIKSAQK